MTLVHDIVRALAQADERIDQLGFANDRLGVGRNRGIGEFRRRALPAELRNALRGAAPPDQAPVVTKDARFVIVGQEFRVDERVDREALWEWAQILPPVRLDRPPCDPTERAGKGPDDIAGSSRPAPFRQDGAVVR